MTHQNPTAPTVPQGEAETTTAPLTTTGDRNRDAACTGVAGEIARTDSKASLLLAFDGAVLAGLASLAEKDLPGFTKVVGVLAVLALAAAAVLLLLVVRPCLAVSRAAPGTFPQWARMDEDALQAEMEQDRRLARIKALSTLADTHAPHTHRGRRRGCGGHRRDRVRGFLRRRAPRTGSSWYLSDTEVSVDTTISRAHQHAAGDPIQAGRVRTGWRPIRTITHSAAREVG